MISNILIYLLSSIPLLFITGPFLSGMGTVLISIFGLYSLSFFSNIKFHKSLKIFFIISILFYFYLLVSSYLGPIPEESFKASLFYFRIILFTLGVYFLINENIELALGLVYRVLVICFSLVFLSILVEYFFINFIKSTSVSQYTGIFFDEKIAGSYVSRLYPLLVSLFIYFEKNLRYLSLTKFLISIFILSFLIVFLSGERSSMAIFIISNLFLILGIKQYRDAVVNKYIFIGIISSFFVFNFLANDTFNRIFIKTYDQIFDEEKINLLSDHHQAHFITAYKMFEENKLLGIGPRGFRNFCDDDKYIFIYKSEIQYNNNKTPKIINNKIQKKHYNGCSTHPHNLLIQILSETGLVGVIFYLIFIYWIYKNLLISIISGKNKLDIISFCALTTLCSSFFPILPSHNFFASYINILNFFILSFYFLKK